MFSFLRKNLVAELVILVVESEYNEQFSMSSHVIVSAPTKINLNELKKRLRGVTGVPPERIMLIFCGQILTNEKEYVPLEAFEPLEVVDEDHLSFMPRLSMRIIDDPVVHVPEEEEDAERRRPVIDDGADTGQAKLKHRHKHRSKGDFDIEKELGGDVNCVAFIPVLRKAGYDNEVQLYCVYSIGCSMYQRLIAVVCSFVPLFDRDHLQMYHWTFCTDLAYGFRLLQLVAFTQYACK